MREVVVDVVRQKRTLTVRMMRCSLFAGLSRTERLH